MIDTAIGGMKTRFIYRGKNPTMLVVASSKRSEQSFMESYIRTLSETQSENTFVVDEPVWKVKPKGTYSDETFFIGLGNKYLDSIVIPEKDRDNLQYYKNKGYQIIEAPVDFKAKALEDIDRALCDYAGISSFSASKFLSAERVNDIIDETIHNPMPDIICVGNGKHDETQYYDFFDWEKLDKRYLDKPLFKDTVGNVHDLNRAQTNTSQYSSIKVLYEDDEDDNDIFSSATSYNIDNPNPDPLPGAIMPIPQPEMIECVRFVSNPARRDDIGMKIEVA